MKLATHIPPADLELATLAVRRLAPALTSEQLVEAIQTYTPGQRQTAAAVPPADFVTIAEYARRLKCCELTVQRMIKAGRLECVRLGRGIRIPSNARPVEAGKAGAK